MNLVRVGQDDARAVPERRDHAHAHLFEPLPEEFQDLAEDRRDVGLREPRLAHAREIEHAADDPRDALHLRADDLQAPGGRLVALKRAEEPLGPAADDV